MNFCNHCGSPVRIAVPDGDNRPRHVCTAGDCGRVHYENPNIVAGCLVEHGERLLLCRRAIEPRYGLWTLPAGFLENGESVEEGARRETREEATAEVEILQLYSMFSLTHINQVYMLFRARLHEGGYSAGEESLDVRLFDESEIPWQQIAFPVIHQTLRHYFEDRRNGEFRTHIGSVRAIGDGPQRRIRVEMLS
ncbi:MAG: NUDIX hydrolase [Gammaproteobacteria bacterium]|jgi:ADP-ribose pyrophosphatase YjhB (NUDIX family)